MPTGQRPAALPVGILTNMLQSVQLQQRLGSCAQVSRTWHSAAVAATPSIKACFPEGSRKEDAMSDWLHHNGECVTSLELGAMDARNPVWSPDHPLSLSCPWTQLTQLQTLQLQDFQLREYTGPCSSEAEREQPICDPKSGTSAADGEAPSSSRRHEVQNEAAAVATGNPLEALTMLTSLHLVRCSIHSPKQLGLGSLSALTNLRQLVLVGVTEDAGRGICTQAASTTLRSALQQLAQLTYLAVNMEQLSDAALTPISSLQQLKELQLSLVGKTAASLANLPTALTQLVISFEHTDGTIPFTASSTPSLCQLKGLLHLGLYAVQVFEPALLTNMQRLQHLDLPDLDVGSWVPAGSDGVFSLLEALSQLTLLRTLNRTRSIKGVLLPDSQHSLYTSLVASSHLTALDLLGCDLPLDVGSLLFAEGRSLPGLRILRLGLEPDDGDLDLDDVGNEDDHPALADGDGIDLLMSCCPGLQELWMINAVGDDHYSMVPLLTALSGLTALTKLAVGGPAVDDDVAEEVLSGLTGLQELIVAYCRYLARPGLLTLTELTSLTKLHVVAFGGDMDLEDNPFEGWQDVTYTASKDGPPDVWQKLEEYCKESKACLRVMVEQRDEKLKEEKEKVGSLQQQLDESQTQLSEAHQQLADLRVQLEQLQQQGRQG